MVTKKNLWRNYAPKNSSFSLKSSNFVTRHKTHHVTKLADRYGNFVTWPRVWQSPKKDCQQLGPEFREPLIKKIWDHIKDFWRKKLIYAKIVTKLGDLTVLLHGLITIYWPMILMCPCIIDFIGGNGLQGWVSRAPSPPLTLVIHSPLWNLLYTGT